MTTSTTTPDSFIASFMYPTLPKIHGRPDFNQLYGAHKLQQVNALEIQTSIGGGAHGYLGAIVNVATYARLVPATPWVTPPNPGPFPIIPAGQTTTAQIRAITDRHTERMRLYKENHAVVNACKKQIINMIEAPYLEGYKQPIIQFNNRQVNDFWDWLYQQYGSLTSQDKKVNTQNFHQDWDPTLPFEAFAAKIDECVEIAAIGGSPISAAQILDNAHDLVFKTALYFESLKVWNRRPVVEKTWANFKLHMATAQSELIEEQNTAQRSGYGQHTANVVLQLEATTEALANLATAAATDRDVVAALTTTNATLQAQATEQLRKIARLEAAAATSRRTTGAIRTRGNTRPPPDPNGYCWKHGYRVAEGHSSATCTNRLTDTNHKIEATRANNMGGSQLNKP